MFKTKDNMVRKFILTPLLTTLLCVSISAKDKKGVIMTVDGEDVPTEEFLYLFQKNNHQQSQPQSLDDYLNLFEIYRLKVAEAKSQGIDTMASFKKEIDMYRRELLAPYVADTVFMNQLIDIAFEREKNMVESSHIMFIRTHDEAKDKRSLELIDSLRTELLNGTDFIELAKTYSQDKFSSDKGGYLGFTPAGTFPYAFETAVYETPEGEISEIVESHVGWHIVKSGARKPAMELNRPAKSYKDVKADVERKVSSPFDSRFHMIRKNGIKNLKARHPEIKTEGLSDEEAYITLLQAEEKDQYKNNPDYRNLVDEYINGSLLYEVSVENVWNKAANDSIGLENYYKANKDKYTWESPHAKGILVQALNDSVANVIKQQIQGMSEEEIVPFIRNNFKKEALAEKFNVPQGVNDMIDNIIFGGVQAKPKVRNFTDYFIVSSRLVETPESLDDVRNSVINDYQEILEQDWVETLKKKHKVEINRKELDKIRKNCGV